MCRPLTRRSLIAATLAAIAAPACAAPRPYALVTERSTIAFQFAVNGVTQTGTVPVETAEIRVDPTNLAKSSAQVTADVRRARTGLVLITQALLSETILDAQNHPIVRFTSKAITLGARGRISEGARIDGDLTLRGVTRAITLDAMLSRPAGTPADDLSVLYVDLSGALSRNAFGATGYAGLVEDRVALDIHAEIRAQG